MGRDVEPRDVSARVDARDAPGDLYGPGVLDGLGGVSDLSDLSGSSGLEGGRWAIEMDPGLRSMTRTQKTRG
jgi:hypothetical protein